MTILFSALFVACIALSASAQTASEPQFAIFYQEGNWSGGYGANTWYGETRDFALTAPAGQPLIVQGGANGGSSVHGWSGPNVRIWAMVAAWATTETEAQTEANNLIISINSNILCAQGRAPARRNGTA